MNELPKNFLGGSPLNRLSWLRTSQPFLTAVLKSPATRWILFQFGQPLLSVQPGTRQRSLARLTTSDIRPVLGLEPFLGQGQHDGEVAEAGITLLEAARFKGPNIVFLGLHEPDGAASALPSSDFSVKSESPEVVAQRIRGTSYFSLDVSDIENDELQKVLQECELAKERYELEFMEPRTALGHLDFFDGSLFAEARSMVDWNSRNKFCSACGSPVYSMWAGWKLSCSSLLPWVDNAGKKPCPTAIGLHNFAHPRTDPVVIMIVINETGDKILLGRNSKWPGGFYSALAGFMEPGESFEDSVKREIREEAGIDVWDVKYHSTQPWPFPANLMVGFYSTANESQQIRTDLDNELSDAKWYSREEILAVLTHPDGTTLTRRDNNRLNAIAEGKVGKEEVLKINEVEVKTLPPFRVPGRTAIAGVLISDWAFGKIGMSTLHSPNL